MRAPVAARGPALWCRPGRAVPIPANRRGQPPPMLTSRNLVRVSAAFGADLATSPDTWWWRDITSYWSTSEDLTITDGRSEGATQAEAGQLTMTLRGTDGALVPGNPASPYYPYVDVGFPIRVEVYSGFGWAEQFSGFVSSLAPTWPDQNSLLCVVSLTATGILDRLGRGEQPVRSPIERAVLADGPVQYWRLDDGEEATQCASAIMGGTPMSVTGAPKFADADGPVGAPGKHLTLREGGVTLGSFSVDIDMDAGSWGVDFWCKFSLDTSPFPGNIFILDIVTNGTYNWTIGAYSLAGASPTPMPDKLVIEMQPRYGPYFGGPGYPSSGYIDVKPGWYHIRASGVDDAGTLTATLTVDGADNSQDYVGDTAGGVIRLTSKVEISFDTSAPVEESYYQSLSMAHLSLHSTPAGNYDDPGIGWPAEGATQRVARLCAEEGITCTVPWGAGETMGVQRPGTFLDLLRECETTDLGRLTEQGFGLAYRHRADLYNQAPALTLAAGAGQVRSPFEPVVDLQRLRNEWTVDREGGGSATALDATSQATRGRLIDSVTINVLEDHVLRHHAAWRVGASSAGGLRYPGIGVPLTSHRELIPLVQDIRPGSRVLVTDLPDQHAPDDLDQVVEGRSMTIGGGLEWDMVLTTSPAAPYDVWVVEGSANTGRLDASAATLDAYATAVATTLSVATASGPLLTTTAGCPADFPFDVELEGERVTVTAISGASSPQTVTVVRSVNGVVKAHQAGTIFKLWRPSHIAL